MNFNLAYFANIAHFEIEESFWSIQAKLQIG